MGRCLLLNYPHADAVIPITVDAVSRLLSMLLLLLC